MGLDQMFCESSVNVISRFTICANREFGGRQFSLFFMIFIKKPATFWVISCEIAKIAGIGSERDFTI